jgi:hypothetical protein
MTWRDAGTTNGDVGDVGMDRGLRKTKTGAGPCGAAPELSIWNYFFFAAFFGAAFFAFLAAAMGISFKP